MSSQERCRQTIERAVLAPPIAHSPTNYVQDGGSHFAALHILENLDVEGPRVMKRGHRAEKTESEKGTV